MNTTLTLMSGLPRIGKSTWIEANKNDALIVSPDIIRAEIFNHQHHAMANDWIFSLGKSMALLLLIQNKDVIIDATNIRMVDRENWFKIADQANQRLDDKVSIRVVTVTTGNAEKDIELSIAHNQTCPKDKAVPSSVIKNMSYNMRYFGQEECVSVRCPAISSSGSYLGATHSGYQTHGKSFNQAMSEYRLRCTNCGDPLVAYKPLRHVTSVVYNPITSESTTEEIVFDKMS